MLVERPDKIRWKTTAPYQTILLGDQNSVAQFEFNDGKWEKLKLGFPQLLQRVMQQMSAMNQGNLGAMLNDYTASVATNADVVLTFVPKDEKCARHDVVARSAFAAGFVHHPRSGDERAGRRPDADHVSK